MIKITDSLTLLQERPSLDSERGRQTLNVVDRYVSRVPLDVADISAMKAALECQRFLSPTAFLSQSN